jgi:hypothetical protein
LFPTVTGKKADIKSAQSIDWVVYAVGAKDMVLFSVNAGSVVNVTCADRRRD